MLHQNGAVFIGQMVGAIHLSAVTDKNALDQKNTVRVAVYDCSSLIHVAQNLVEALRFRFFRFAVPVVQKAQNHRISVFLPGGQNRVKLCKCRIGKILIGKPAQIQLQHHKSGCLFGIGIRVGKIGECIVSENVAVHRIKSDIRIEQFICGFRTRFRCITDMIKSADAKKSKQNEKQQEQKRE